MCRLSISKVTSELPHSNPEVSSGLLSRPLAVFTAPAVRSQRYTPFAFFHGPEGCSIARCSWPDQASCRHRNLALLIAAQERYWLSNRIDVDCVVNPYAQWTTALSISDKPRYPNFIDRANQVFMQILNNCGYHVAVKKSKPMGAASVQTDKVVNVRMTEAEHTLLKAYCASLNRSMQDVVSDFALMEVQKQHSFCRIVRSLMEDHVVPGSQS